MRIYTTILSLFFVLLGAAQASVETEALSGWEVYRGALLKKDSDTAWSAIDTRTKGFYETALKQALTASRTELSKLDMVSKFTVLRCRVEFTRSQIEKMTARELFATGVQRGWISRSSVEALTGLRPFSSDKRSASFSLLTQPTIPVLHLVKENDTWRVELWRSFAPASESLRQSAIEKGYSEDEFVIELLKVVSRPNIDESVWDAPSEK